MQVTALVQMPPTSQVIDCGGMYNTVKAGRACEAYQCSLALPDPSQYWADPSQKPSLWWFSFPLASKGCLSRICKLCRGGVEFQMQMTVVAVLCASNREVLRKNNLDRLGWHGRHEAAVDVWAEAGHALWARVGCPPHLRQLRLGQVQLLPRQL